MRTRFLFLPLVFALATLVTPGAIAQEVPDTPETPDAEPAAEAAPAPEADPAPEAEPAPEPDASAEPTAGVEPALPALPASTLFETTLDFVLVKKMNLGGRAGEVEVRGVEFGSKSVKGGVFGTSDADLKATITARLECSTEAEKKQKIDITILFLDEAGDVIDRAANNGSLKAESKFIDINHTTLKYVVPLIKKVKITAESKG